MASNDLSLLIYTPITGTSVFMEDIAKVATDYWHSIRLLGGYWQASFTLNADDIAPALYNEWRTNRRFYHLVEQYKGQTTWEGSIEEIQPDDAKQQISVTAYGYVHSIQNQYNSTTDTASTANASDWLETLRATDCEFIQVGYYEPNTIQCYQAGTDKVWTEMLKVVELAQTDAPVVPWQIGVYQDRRLYYQPVSTTPRGYVREGIRWRTDLVNELYNSVIVRYTDETGAAQTDITATRPESMSRYGTREIRLQRTNLPTNSATALAYAYLYAHCWPVNMAVGCGRDIQIYDSIGCNRAIDPWLVQPGVFADTTLIGAPLDQATWMTDGSHFFVDEVIARQTGVQLRTAQWTELDAWEAWYDYQARAPKPHKKRKKPKK